MSCREMSCREVVNIEGCTKLSSKDQVAAEHLFRVYLRYKDTQCRRWALRLRFGQKGSSYTVERRAGCHRSRSYPLSRWTVRRCAVVVELVELWSCGLRVIHLIKLGWDAFFHQVFLTMKILDVVLLAEMRRRGRPLIILVLKHIPAHGVQHQSRFGNICTTHAFNHQRPHSEICCQVETPFRVGVLGGETNRRRQVGFCRNSS